MSKQTVFECDLCGDRFGAKNDVWEITIRRIAAGSDRFTMPHEYDVHICDCFLDIVGELPETDVSLLDTLSSTIRRTAYVGIVDRGLGDLSVIHIYITTERGSTRFIDADELSDEFRAVLEGVA